MKFRIFVSTKRLLCQASGKDKLHVDATYKLNWQGFPVLLVGTTDMDCHFHVFGMAMCSNEKTADFKFIFESISYGLAKINQGGHKPVVLISDGADSIHNAFSNVFSKKDMVMCWPHMCWNLNKKAEAMVNKSHQDELIEDIETLQKSQNKEIFKKASGLFLKKWKTLEPELSRYFEAEWLNSH